MCNKKEQLQTKKYIIEFHLHHPAIIIFGGGNSNNGGEKIREGVFKTIPQFPEWNPREKERRNATGHESKSEEPWATYIWCK